MARLALLGQVAAQRQHVLHPRGLHVRQHMLHLLPCRLHARQVAQRRYTRFRHSLRHGDGMPRRAARRAVGHGHKRRMQSGNFLRHGGRLCDAVKVLGWENLARQGDFLLIQDACNAHRLFSFGRDAIRWFSSRKYATFHDTATVSACQGIRNVFLPHPLASLSKAWHNQGKETRRTIRNGYGTMAAHDSASPH